MSQKKKGLWIAISICGILTVLIIVAAGIFIYRTQRGENRGIRQNITSQNVVTPDATVLAGEKISLDVYDKRGQIYNDYTLCVTKDGEETRYTGTTVHSDGVTFPEVGMYEIQIIDNADPDNVTTMTIEAVEEGGVSQLPIYTQGGDPATDESAETTPQTEEQTSPSAPAPEEIYADILDMFYHNIQTGWEAYNEMSSFYGNEFCYMFPMYYSDPSYIDNIGYAFIDLNGDGMDELLIGMDTEEEQQYNEVFQNVIYDMYTYMDGQIIHLATSGERFTYQLCEDNTIYYFGSSGAASNAYYHYQLDSSEPVLSVLDCVYSEPDEDWENTYWYHVTSGTYDPESYSHEGEEATIISEAEATAIRESWPQRIDFPLTYFGEYTPQNVDGVEAETQVSDDPSENVLTQAQLEALRTNLGIPEGLEVETTQSEMSYWDAGQCWVVTVTFTSNGNIVASATVNAETGEMLRDILMYNG